MAYTKKEQAYQKKRYRTNKKYREHLIKTNTEKHKKNKPKYNKIMRDYYHGNEEYRKRKIAKMRAYNKAHNKKKKK